MSKTRILTRDKYIRALDHARVKIPHKEDTYHDVILPAWFKARFKVPEENEKLKVLMPSHGNFLCFKNMDGEEVFMQLGGHLRYLAGTGIYFDIHLPDRTKKHDVDWTAVYQEMLSTPEGEPIPGYKETVTFRESVINQFGDPSVVE